MRNLSDRAKASVISDDGNDEVFLACLVISSKNDTFHLVANNAPVTGSSGQPYEAYPFEVVLPNDTKSEVSSISLTIDNVHPRLVTMLRGESEPPEITLKILLWSKSVSQPDDITPEILIEDLKLVGVDWNAATIQGTLIVDDVLNQKFPSNGETFSPIQYEGLF